jgi:hypothetical protein
VADHRVGRQGPLSVAQRRFARGKEGRGPLRLLAVDRPDGAAGGPDAPAAGSQPDLSRRVDSLELLTGDLDQVGQIRPA